MSDTDPTMERALGAVPVNLGMGDHLNRWRDFKSKFDIREFGCRKEPKRISM